MTAHALTEDEKRETREEFQRVVNMTPAKLREWLDGEESRSVGMRPGGGRVSEPGGEESVGHHMGGRILQIRQRKGAELTDEDYADMRKVIGYVRPGVASVLMDVTFRREYQNRPLEDRSEHPSVSPHGSPIRCGRQGAGQIDG